jgi:sugar O-acyltransferase (sialic acid O-acetyltransferase NeuD family)
VEKVNKVVHRLLILGAGGHGMVVADIARAMGYDGICFLDDRWPELSHVLKWPVVGKFKDLSGVLRPTDQVFAAIGGNAMRLALHRSLTMQGLRIPVLRHPSSVVSDDAQLGSGSVVMPLAAINLSAVIGEAVILNTSCSVDHDNFIEDGVHISPGVHLAGNVSVGSCSWIGIGSNIREGITIGSGCMVGAGSVVVRDVPPASKVAGNPARPMEKRAG